MPELSRFEQEKERFSTFSEPNLITYIAGGVSDPVLHSAAVAALHDIQQARENSRHAELLAEIKKPHWSVTPGFLVGVVAMIAACIAAYPVLFPQPQAQQSVVIAPPVQITQPEHSMPASSPLPSSHSAAEN